MIANPTVIDPQSGDAHSRANQLWKSHRDFLAEKASVFMCILPFHLAYSIIIQIGSDCSRNTMRFKTPLRSLHFLLGSSVEAVLISPLSSIDFVLTYDQLSVISYYLEFWIYDRI